MACTLSAKPTQTPILISPSPSLAPLNPTMPYLDASYLLDGVCFAALSPYSGTSFIWNTQTELDTFWETLNLEENCLDAVPPPQFNFDQHVIAGTIQTAQGCNATFSSPEIQQIGQIIGVTVSLDVQAGCDYDLLATFTAAFPRPAAGLSLVLSVSP